MVYGVKSWFMGHLDFRLRYRHNLLNIKEFLLHPIAGLRSLVVTCGA